MNKFTFSLIVLLLTLGLLAGLVWLTAAGNIAAAITLGAVSALILIAIGFSLYTLTGHLHAHREQLNFAANAKENLAIIAAMQHVQNQQNSQLLRQLRQAPALAANTLDLDAALTFDEAIFSELDSGEETP